MEHWSIISWDLGKIVWDDIAIQNYGKQQILNIQKKHAYKIHKSFITFLFYYYMNKNFVCFVNDN